MQSEEPVYEAIIHWIEHKEGRKEQLHELLQHVRIPLLTPRYITDVIDKQVRSCILTSFQFVEKNPSQFCKCCTPEGRRVVPREWYLKRWTHGPKKG